MLFHVLNVVLTVDILEVYVSLNYLAISEKIIQQVSRFEF